VLPPSRWRRAPLASFVLPPPVSRTNPLLTFSLACSRSPFVAGQGPLHSAEDGVSSPTDIFSLLVSVNLGLVNEILVPDWYDAKIVLLDACFFGTVAGRGSSSQ
jgi:hypothetical protein